MTKTFCDSCGQEVGTVYVVRLPGTETTLFETYDLCELCMVNLKGMLNERRTDTPKTVRHEESSQD